MTMVRIRSFRGLGAAYALPEEIARSLTPINPSTVAAVQRAAASEGGLPSDVFQAIQASSVTAGAGTTGAEDSRKCDCLVQKAAETAAEMGQTLPPDAMMQLHGQCMEDSAAFGQLLSDMLGTDPKACDPWYKQPRNLIIGAAVVAAGGLLLWSRK
jgi:hypothetical protein